MIYRKLKLKGSPAQDRITMGQNDDTSLLHFMEVRSLVGREPMFNRYFAFIQEYLAMKNANVHDLNALLGELELGYSVNGDSISIAEKWF